MKYLYLAIFLQIISNLAMGQAPSKISYQALVSDENNRPLVSKTVSIKISIIRTDINGAVVYTEEHHRSTSDMGYISMEIGMGNTPSSNFSDIDWSGGRHFIKTEIDPEGGSNYATLGISQMLSVPYALFAKDVKRKEDADSDPMNEIELPQVAAEGALINYKDSKWSDFHLGSENMVLKVKEGIPQWVMGRVPRCDDNVQNGQELGVDCGGECYYCADGTFDVVLYSFEEPITEMAQIIKEYLPPPMNSAGDALILLQDLPATIIKGLSLTEALGNMAQLEGEGRVVGLREY